MGGLTFGIGLIPYAIVLGVTAVAGGTAASTMQWKRPSDSRLIIGDIILRFRIQFVSFSPCFSTLAACETISDAMEWKAALESEICRLEEVQQPLLPSIVDLHAISSIIHNSTVVQVVTFHCCSSHDPLHCAIRKGNGEMSGPLRVSG